MAPAARRKAPARRASSTSRRKPRTPAPSRVLLDGAERALLRRACARYRAQIPSYLESGETELRLLMRVLRKL